jgi:hypothetical protein
MEKKGKDNGKKSGQPKFNLDKISKDLGEIEHKQYIDNLEPALTSVFLKHAETKDKKTGVVTYKSKFTKGEAEKLSNDLYDALVYHSHRRVFQMDDKSFKNLSGFKDPNGNPYTDVVGQHHYSISRKALAKRIASDDENDLSIKGLEKILEKPLERHAGLLTSGLLEKEGLADPENMQVVKNAIDKIVDKYHLNKKKFNTKKIHDHEQLLNLYVGLSKEHYSNK